MSSANGLNVWPAPIRPAARAALEKALLGPTLMSMAGCATAEPPCGPQEAHVCDLVIGDFAGVGANNGIGEGNRTDPSCCDRALRARARQIGGGEAGAE